jgi:hypothetical protein
MMMAAKHGRIDVLRALLGKGADANIVNKVGTLDFEKLTFVPSTKTRTLMSNVHFLLLWVLGW